MRIKVTLKKENFILPIGYQSILQGTIYALLSKNSLGDLYHNKGYSYKQKKFKCFVFSNIFGKHTIENKHFKFDDEFYFYISSQDERFLKEIYLTLTQNKYLFINKESIEIINISISDIKPFKGEKNITIKSLSPVLIYSTKDNYSTYYKISDEKSESFIIQNLKDKALAYNYPLSDLSFHILSIDYEKERLVKFKNCIYRSYMTQVKIKTNFETLLFIYNCGLSCKGSCGFGMIEIINEEECLPV